MIKGHSVCHKIEVDDSLPGPNFHFLVFKYHANYHRPQSYGSASKCVAVLLKEDRIGVRILSSKGPGDKKY